MKQILTIPKLLVGCCLGVLIASALMAVDADKASAMQVTCSLSNTPLDCLTCNAYYEAANEPNYGQRLTAYSVLNRSFIAFRNRREVCATVWDNLQYSWTNGFHGHRTGNIDPEKWTRARENARLALYVHTREYRNMFENCITHYYAKYIRAPFWVRDASLFLAGQIATHIFYGDIRLGVNGQDCRRDRVTSDFSRVVRNTRHYENNPNDPLASNVEPPDEPGGQYRYSAPAEEIPSPLAELKEAPADFTGDVDQL